MLGVSRQHFTKWLYFGLHIKRWLALLVIAVAIMGLGFAYLLREVYVSYTFPESAYWLTLQFIPRWLRGVLFVSLAGGLTVFAGWRLNRSLASALLPAAQADDADADGNIDIVLWNSTGSLNMSDSTADNETIDFPVAAPGTYYIQVKGGSGVFDNNGNTYDLWWDDVPPGSDDPYEVNNTFATAWATPLVKEQLLSSFGGWEGIQLDDDWYQIIVTAGNERVEIDCSSASTAGDINIQLVDSTGAVVATSDTITNNEYIDFVVIGPSTYFVRVYGTDLGTVYDLWWEDDTPASSTSTPTTTTNDDDDCGCSPQQAGIPALGSVIGTILSWFPLMLLLLLRKRHMHRHRLKRAAEHL